jgi:DNA-binding transcriptional MerR regulator
MHPLNAKYSIKDLERLSGVKAHTIRIWEQRYNLLTPDRTDTNIRLYSDHDVKLLLNISLLIRHGGKISHLSKLSLVEISQKIIELSRSTTDKTSYFEVQIDQLVLSMIEFDDARFEQTISDSVLKHGFEITMLNAIIPFLQKVGMMWLSGESSILQEHFISSLVRKNLIIAINSLPAVRDPQADSFMLFLPEGELHETGLLFSNYILKARGKKVTYMGQTLPREDVQSFCREHKPNYILTFFTAAHSVASINQYLKDLNELSGNTRVLVAGMQIHDPAIEIPTDVTFISNVMDLIQLAEGSVQHLKTGTGS